MARRGVECGSKAELLQRLGMAVNVVEWRCTSLWEPQRHEDKKQGIVVGASGTLASGEYVPLVCVAKRNSALFKAFVDKEEGIRAGSVFSLKRVRARRPQARDASGHRSVDLLFDEYSALEQSVSPEEAAAAFGEGDSNISLFMDVTSVTPDGRGGFILEDQGGAELRVGQGFLGGLLSARIREEVEREGEARITAVPVCLQSVEDRQFTSVSKEKGRNVIRTSVHLLLGGPPRSPAAAPTPAAVAPGAPAAAEGSGAPAAKKQRTLAGEAR